MRVIFHLQDPSTDFLKPIYEGLKDIIVVRGNIEADLANQLIENASQVIMMGHGGPHCLFGYRRVLIGEENVQSLKKKDNNIFIWCHASEFVFNHELKGFATGMFISEDGEAQYCLEKTDYDTFKDRHSVVQSNELIADVVGKALAADLNINELSALVKFAYNPLAITHYNKNVLNYNAKLLTLIQ